MTNIISEFTASQHHIQREGLGFSRALTNEELQRKAPAIFATSKHKSRSARYAYVSTLDLLGRMRGEGFFPVNVSQARVRDTSSEEFGKHLIRFRREDQMQASEAREVILVNSHNGASALQLMAGVFRCVCANGLIVGSTDFSAHVRHTGNVADNVIEGAYHVINEFNKVTESIEGMKQVTLTRPHQIAFAKAALSLRFEDAASCGIEVTKLLSVKRREDNDPTLWNTFNVIQEHVIKGGDRGAKQNANGQWRRVSTREVKGIAQNVALNRGLWTLADEMRKLVAA